MRIPELIGGYRPGDVVNGYVLTERGHWVELDNPRAAGLRERRFLSTEVSTLRDARSPARILTEREGLAAAAASSVQTLGAATSYAPHGASPTYVPSTAYTPGPTTAPPAAAPPGQHHGDPTPYPGGPAPGPATPSSANQGPAPLPRVRAAPSTAAPAPRPPQATDGSPQRTGRQGSSASKVIAIVVVAFVLVQIIVGLASRAGGTLGSLDDDPGPAGETSSTVHVGEVALLDDWVWEQDGTLFFLVDVAPDAAFETPASLMVFVDAYAPDGHYLGPGWHHVIVADDSPVRVVSELEATGTEIGWWEVTLESSPLPGPVGAIGVESWEVREGTSPPVLRVHVAERLGKNVGLGSVTAVVRDGTGHVLAGAVVPVDLFAPGQDAVVDVPLTSLVEIPEDATIEVTTTSE